MKSTADVQNPEERRRFERVDITHEAQVLVLHAKDRKAGVLRQLARELMIGRVVYLGIRDILRPSL